MQNTEIKTKAITKDCFKVLKTLRISLKIKRFINS